MQVEVPEHEQRFLRFLWREGPSSEIETFQYTRHIFGALTLGNRVVPSNNEASGLNELQSSLASTLPSNIDNSLQSTYVLPSSQLRSFPTAVVSHGKTALPSFGPSRAPIASTGNVLHPLSGMSFSNFSLLNSQPSVGVPPKVNISKVAQACTVNNNSARLVQQPNPQIPFCV